MWCEEGVCLHELRAEGALDGGFYFGFRTGGDTNLSLAAGLMADWEEEAYSFLNILRDWEDETGGVVWIGGAML